MKFKIYILLILILTSCDFHTAAEYYNEAIDLEKKGNYKRAILFHNKAIKKDSKFRASLNNRAVDKALTQDFKGAILDYKAILKFDSDNTRALYSIGDNFFELKEYKKAIKYYTVALNTKGCSKTYATSKGTGVRFNQKIDFKHFDSDNEYNVLDCHIYFARGNAYLNDKQFDRAIKDLKKSLKVNNSIKDCYFLLGKAYVGKKDSINACHNFISSAKLGDKEAREMLRNHCIEK